MTTPPPGRPSVADVIIATESTTANELLGGPGRSVVAAWVNGDLRDLAHELKAGDEVAPVPASSEEGLSIIRHSCAHVLAQAVQTTFEEVRLGIGPPIRNGFYYDFQVTQTFVPDDLKTLETAMKGIIKSDQRFVRRVVNEHDATQELSHEPFKLELVNAKGGSNLDRDASVEVGAGELTIYDNVDKNTGQVIWSDLCRGPHVPSTRYIPAFKLTRTAAAYWRGSEKNPQLQRIYGTAWDTKQSLANHMEMLREAERRDHRRLGKELEIFHLDPSAPGMPYWLPKGMRLLNNLLAFWREEHETRGYEEISSPLINHKRLWVTSGHWDHYRDDMFLIEGDDPENAYGVKPMNCPNAMVVYNLKTRSYRDLPLRLSDCDPLHRDERSGALHGLLRVQKFQQDDAHIFLPESQIRDEYQRIFDICDRFYSIFGLTYRFRIGTRPEKFIGDVATWDAAEEVLTEILNERTGGDYDLEPGDGAFYGPKIDIMMSDVFGRDWQMGTIQLDFQLPRRFGCLYTDENGERVAPVVIHRVIYGSLERFLGIYIEHTGGAFPLWLSPTHVSVIPVAADHAAYSEDVAAALRNAGIRVEVDARNETLGNRVRVSQMQKVPLTLVLGENEVKNRTLTVRARGSRATTTVPLRDFVDRVSMAIRTRQDDVTFTTSEGS